MRFRVNRARLEVLFGQTAREIGILVAVFAPLDAAFASYPLNTTIVGVVMVLAICSIVVGILVEAGGSA